MLFQERGHCFLPFCLVLGEMPIMKNNFEGNQRSWRKTLTAMNHIRDKVFRNFFHTSSH